MALGSRSLNASLLIYYKLEVTYVHPRNTTSQVHSNVVIKLLITAHVTKVLDPHRKRISTPYLAALFPSRPSGLRHDLPLFTKRVAFVFERRERVRAHFRGRIVALRNLQAFHLEALREELVRNRLRDQHLAGFLCNVLNHMRSGPDTFARERT